MDRRYYYIISGLPELAINANQLPFKLSELRDQIWEQLSPDDRELFGMMLAPVDNRNLIRLLSKQQDAFDPDGNYSLEELSTGLDMPELLPSYMQDFLETYKEKSEQLGPVQLESALLDLFVDFASRAENNFIRDWYSFNHNIRNLLTGLNCRKFDLNLDTQVKGSNDIAVFVRTRKEKDFDLGKVLPYADQVVSYFEQKNLQVREFELEQLKWDKLDELTAEYDFTIEIILAYVAKMRLIQRSLELPEEEGKEKLEVILTDILADKGVPDVFY